MNKGIHTVLLSSLLLLSGCGEDNVIQDSPGPKGLDFNLVLIDNVSEPEAGGLRMIDLTFSDKNGNSMKMRAGSGYRHLEAGWYTVTADADDRLEAEISLSLGDESVEVSGGSVFVRKNNYEYTISLELETAEGKINAMADRKRLYFDSEVYSSLSTGSDGNFLKDQQIRSEIMNTVMNYSVYLPETYDGTRKYPVLYILHGMDGSNNDWLQDNTGGLWAGGGTMPSYAKEYAEQTGKELIIVAPDGENWFYCDGYNSGPKYMSYFFEEFIPYIESTYAIRAERGSRAIGGLSMGGYGSLYYGTLHPEMFCHVYACSAAVYGAGMTPQPIDFITRAVASGRDRELPGFTIEIGTEDFLFADNERFIKELDSCNIPYEYITRSGAHDWKFWNACSPKIIRKVLTIFE